MRVQKIERHTLYGILSIACPVAIVCGVLLYQYSAHRTFWATLTLDESWAGVGMALDEFFQLLMFTVFACVAGLLLAWKSLALRARLFSLGSFGVALNGLPLLFFVLMSAREAIGVGG
jgi:hypothetical protein